MIRFVKLRILQRMVKHWVLMLTGRSYWHAPQGMGTAFVPDALEGYFNDMTAKTVWQGPQNSQGLPLVEAHGELVLFPTTLFQKALGHWDLMLKGPNISEHKEEFLKIAYWALETQDAQGGWPLWPLLKQSFPSLYSGMTQGEGISVLVRAYKITQDERLMHAARRAVVPMAREINEGGVSRRTPEGIVLEEFPYAHLNGVFNGWVFAVFGLRDFLFIDNNIEARRLLEDSVSALVKMLPQYRMAYWSKYDLSGNIASPFYHDLHIAQLKALAFSFPEHEKEFNEMHITFKKFSESKINRVRAMGVKLRQKLIKPSEVVIR